MKMKGKMNSYAIEITESVVRHINITAASEFEAIEKATREYRNQGIPLGTFDYESIDFKVRERHLRRGV